VKAFLLQLVSFAGSLKNFDGYCSNFDYVMNECWIDVDVKTNSLKLVSFAGLLKLVLFHEGVCWML
jgi:hypothetical protein